MVMTRIAWMLGWISLVIVLLFVASVWIAQNGIYPQ
jgi:hypothetical protein